MRKRPITTGIVVNPSTCRITAEWRTPTCLPSELCVEPSPAPLLGQPGNHQRAPVCPLVDSDKKVGSEGKTGENKTLDGRIYGGNVPVSGLRLRGPASQRAEGRPAERG